MTDTTDMRRDFEAWYSEHFWQECEWDELRNCYVDVGCHYAWKGHQAATERATAIERERCAQVCEYEQAKTASTAKFCLVVAELRPYDICAAAIRQGGAA